MSLEQRVYRRGGQHDLSPDGLADALIDHFDPPSGIQAQRIGQMGPVVVQVGYGDVPEAIKHAVTVTIVPDEVESGGIVVTIGKQYWLTPTMMYVGGFGAMMAGLVSPWFTLMLLWPLTDLAEEVSLVHAIGEQIEQYVRGQGGNLAERRTLAHPHDTA